MKKIIITITALLVFVGIILTNLTYATDENIEDIKYYNTLIENQKIVTIELVKNTKLRKTTKKEIMEYDTKIQQIKDAQGNIIENENIVKTGDYITINDEDYVVVLYGDVNQDGYICDIEDIMKVQNDYLGTSKINEIQKLAGNLENKDNTLDIEDIMKMINTYLGTLESRIITNIPTGYLDFDNQDEDDEDNKQDENKGDTPVEIHGKLKVEGTNIVDEQGNNFQLKGVSTHGLQWYPQYVNQESFTYMQQNWGINAIRLAMYTGENEGYTPELHKIVENGVEYAKNAGIYAIIDWHILSEGNPNSGKEKAKVFFTEMATKYKDYDNVLYEICNEPNGNVQWDRDIKPYAEEIIQLIRAIDNDAIIIVGTPTWSQDVDIVANNPITGYDNIMYTLHFYAATHKEYLRQKLQTALNAGLPIFVTEFGSCDASGNGIIDENEANIWIDYLNERNISWMCWNLSNKDEASALLKNTDKTTGGWTQEELSQSGKWLLQALKR